MQAPRPILVAYDFDESGARALAAAHALAKDLGCGVLLAHAFERVRPIERAGGAAALDERDVAQVARLETEDARRLTEEAAAPLRADGVEVEVVARQGIPWEVVLEEAQARDCPMVVVGTTGRKGLKALWHGSVAKTVLHRSGVPVLVVPARLGHAQATALHRTILVATDFSRASDAAVEAAVRLARDLRAKVHLLHVVEVRSGIAKLPEGTHPRLEAAEGAMAAEAALEASRARAAQHVGVTPAIRTGQPAETILDEARRAGASLVVAGTHGRSGLMRFLLGSVAQDLLQRTDRPILVVPDPGGAPRGDWIR